MSNLRNPEFIKGMNLNRDEIATFEKYISLLEKAEKHPSEFLSGQALAFTPAALLVVAVAEFVYQVYRDYGSVAVNAAEFQVRFRDVIRKLNKLESMSEDYPSLDIYAQLREDIAALRKTVK